jgi:hypothetical protein
VDDLVDPPWSRVRQLQLIRREIREHLSAAAVELLLSTADVVLEGDGELDGDPDRPRSPGTRERVYTTLMATIDLAACAGAIRERTDAATAQRVAELMADNPVVRGKLEARAREHAASVAGLQPDGPDARKLQISLDYEVRAEGRRIFIDADIVASPGRRRRG